MEPTVLAGPVEFSPADIALILAVLAAAFVVLTAPGWAVVGYAAHRRRRRLVGPGRTWPAVLGGCVAGLALSAATSFLVAGLTSSFLGGPAAPAVLASWAACWGLAWVWSRPTAGQRDASRTAAAPEQQGWGR